MRSSRDPSRACLWRFEAASVTARASWSARAAGKPSLPAIPAAVLRHDATALMSSTRIQRMSRTVDAVRCPPTASISRPPLWCPAPGSDVRSNSSTSRRAPDRPRPSPPPVVQPSVRACSRSAMPGPVSAKVTRTPGRPLAEVITSTWAMPPPPWTSAFLASSLAAVTSLVWSTRDRPPAAATVRTCCRTRTTSSPVLIGSSSITGCPASACPSQHSAPCARRPGSGPAR